MYKNVSSGQNTWRHYTYNFTGESTGTYGFGLKFTSEIDGQFTVYFDDFAISKEGVSEDQFGKYEFMNGTSMATPFVTAAVGMVSNKYNETDALKVKEKVLQSVRPATSLTGKVATGGVLDLSKLPVEAVIPTLNLPTNESSATWSNVNTIPVQNTVEGKTYQYSIDGGTTWLDCSNNNIVLTEDGSYLIKVREKDAENVSDTYIYKLDTTVPEITVNPYQVIEEVEQVSPKIILSDVSSGIKSTSIEYTFSTSTTAPESTEFKTANLTNGEVTLISPENATGAYYLYIKPIEDNVTNKSSTEVHRYGPYQLKATVSVTLVTLNESEITMHQGETYSTLKATINPSDATNKNITWSSSDTTVVKVNGETGEITAKDEGEATITVTTEDGNKTATCEVTVVNPSLNLTTQEASATWIKPTDISSINQIIELKNTIEGKEYEYSTDGGNNWTTCNYNDTEKKWSFNITTEGTHKIKIRLENSTVISDEYIYKIDASRPVISIEGEKDNPTNIQITVTDEYSGLANNNIEYVFAKNEPTTETVWNIATLDGEGKANLVLPDSDGKYNIYIKPLSDNVGIQSIENGNHVFEGYTFNSIIPVTEISLNKNSVTLTPGGTEQLIATVLPENATNKKVEWSSSNTSVATVLDDGTVTAIGKGTTTITATSVNGGFTAQCDVDIIIPLTGVTLTKTAETLEIGETTLLQTVLSPLEASITKTEWSSSDEDVAIVTNGLVKGISKGTVDITVSVTDEEGTIKTASCIITIEEVISPEVEITGINLNKESTIIHQGESEKLIATILPDNATNQDVKWTSSNPLVATVSDDGTITAVNKGETTITVSTEDGTITDTCNVTVIIPLIEVSVTETASVEIGKTTNLTEVINPSAASIKKIEWSSSDELIAEVDNNGIVTGIAEGTVEITVKVTDLEGTEKIDTCEVTVTQKVSSDIIPITEISLGNTDIQLNRNTTQKINLIITPQDADIKSIQWTSSNPEVATVDNEGIVTTLATGETVITVTVEDKLGNVKTQSCQVSVIVPIEGVTLNKTVLNLTEKSTEKLIVTINPQDANIQSINWSSSNENIAKVDNNGIVTAISKGIAEITVTVTDKDGNIKTATCKLTVTEVVKDDDEKEQEPTIDDEQNGEEIETTTKPAEKEDLTTSTDILPATGIKGLIITSIVVLSVLSISFIRYRNLRDVK